ncbi:hypothetical protein NDU88_007764 [Pleurodeles waltl]|uniref:Uncharacterized protein n=1 Tax=Pleurodeles waltl TaxID=8319 RepID=A0AAV7PSC9_PLEWA|nr:hypothetical protein NDU88_007764 [Pleurodeles waltl]
MFMSSMGRPRRVSGLGGQLIFLYRWSRSASSGLVPTEEELDYEDEVPVLDVRAVSAQKAVLRGQAVQGDRLSSQREAVGGLRRGVNNDLADALSRFQWQRFRGLALGADVLKTAVPRELWELGE